MELNFCFFVIHSTSFKELSMLESRVRLLLLTNEIWYNTILKNNNKKLREFCLKYCTKNFTYSDDRSTVSTSLDKTFQKKSLPHKFRTVSTDSPPLRPSSQRIPNHFRRSGIIDFGPEDGEANTRQLRFRFLVRERVEPNQQSLRI